jgi:hypothetical protein
MASLSRSRSLRSINSLTSRNSRRTDKKTRMTINTATKENPETTTHNDQSQPRQIRFHAHILRIESTISGIAREMTLPLSMSGKRPAISSITSVFTLSAISAIVRGLASV